MMTEARHVIPASSATRQLLENDELALSTHCSRSGLFKPKVSFFQLRRTFR
jgi:hypothetical protein